MVAAAFPKPQDISICEGGGVASGGRAGRQPRAGRRRLPVAGVTGRQCFSRRREACYAQWYCVNKYELSHMPMSLKTSERMAAEKTEEDSLPAEGSEENDNQSQPDNDQAEKLGRLCG